MGKVVETKKKKKGRPSLLDLQKRTLKQQQEQEEQQKQLSKSSTSSKKNNSTTTPPPSSIHNSATPPLRRSTRRNPNFSPEDEEDDEEGERREKKLKLVVKLQKSSRNSDSEGDDEEDNDGDDGSELGKKRINAIGGGSGGCEKGEKSVSGTNSTNNNQGSAPRLDSGPSTPLPDKKLLLFILDRLQKKDTYGVFSEPVDPEELPDYHEIIEHPMDFGTVRKKVNNGGYANLEEFEKDVFLICTNAMQYNAPDTIYFRQARSIHELAKKNFENLRQDSDDNNEAEPKVVRRGRPPTKNFKKQPGRPSLERVHAEFSANATLATGQENAIRMNLDLRKGPVQSQKSGFTDLSGRIHGYRGDVHAGSWVENKYERNGEASMSYTMKYGKKQSVPDESRRDTYLQSQQTAGGLENSVLNTFNTDRKQLMPVGLHTDHGYTRSLARFAANLGPTAWKVAARKIERCLPPGVKFGPGWVGENDVVPQRPLLQSSSPIQLSSLQAFSLPDVCSGAMPTTGEPEEYKLTEKQGERPMEKHLSCAETTQNNHLKQPVTTPESCVENAKVVAEETNNHSGSNMQNSSNEGASKSRPPFQSNPNPLIRPGMNGFNGTYGFNLPAHMGKLMDAAKSAGFSFPPSQAHNAAYRTNTNFAQPNSSSMQSDSPKSSDKSSTINPGRSMPVPEHEASAASRLGNHPPSWPQGAKPDPKLSSSVPPDLNLKFQSPGSPSATRVDTTQPDLALQL